MTSTVTLPLWVVVTLAVLAAWTLVGVFFLPTVRWFFRRRVERLVERLNRRLPIRLQPIKFAKRDALIERLRFDREVLKALEAEATEKGVPRDVLVARVERYAHEIVPSFNAYLYFRVAYRFARAVARSIYRVRLASADEAALAGIAPESTVVFLINHRSNMDYILVSYLAAERTALSYAVGEWARIWPLQTLIRSMGAYFVRRNSGDPLYRKVLERYVATATEEGVTQAVFPEGGLSRDGRLRPAKLGLLDYMLRGFDPGGERDLVFVPVGINYDRVLEDRTLLLDAEPSVGEAPRAAAAALPTTLGFVARNLGQALLGRWHRFGYACVSFGAPLSVRGYLAERGVDLRRLPKEQRTTHVAALAQEMMRRIGAIVPVPPVPLVASVLVAEPERTFSDLELKAAAFARAQELRASGHQVYLPRGDESYAFTVGLRMLTLRRLVQETAPGLYRAAPEELPVLRYYAGSIAEEAE